MVNENHTASLDQVRIFHDLSKQETFLVVVLGATPDCVDICDARETGISAAGRVDVDECIPRPVTVLFGSDI